MWELDYKETEHGRIDAFELCCWRRLLRISWTARRSNQSILKEISPEYSSEGLMLKLKLPILWPHDAKNWLIGKDPDDWERLKVGRERDNKGWDGWMASLTQWTWVWVSSGSWRWTGKPGVLQSMGSQIVGHDWATELNWTEDYIFLKFLFLQTNAALEYTFTLKTKKVQSVIISPPEKTNYIYIDRLQEFLLYKYTYACMLSHIHAPCDTVDCSSPGSSVHGIFQAWILEWENQRVLPKGSVMEMGLVALLSAPPP